MSACAICPDPGACCREFKLEKTFDARAPRADVQKWVDRVKDSDGNSFPFDAVRSVEDDADEDRPRVRWVFSCRKLGSDGRCTIYDERPHPCREYEPGRDGLCVLHAEGFELALPVLPEVSFCGPREGAGPERP